MRPPQPRSGLALLLALSLLSALLGAATGSATALAQPEEPALPEFELLDQTLDVERNRTDNGQGGHPGLLLWPEGRRAYQLVGSPPVMILPYDLDTLEPVTEIVDGEPEQVTSVTLSPPGLDAENTYSPGPETIALDGERGVAYVPHHRTEVETCREEGITPVGYETCLGGIHVLDLGDDVLAHRDLPGPNPIPFRPIGLDGVIQSPLLRAMRHTDALGGAQGKLHLLVEEASSGNAAVFDVRRSLGVLSYLVQIDVATGSHDWVTPVPGCRRNRISSAADVRSSAVQAGYAVFAGGTGDNPAILIGCYGPSGVGTAVRVTLDPDDPVNAPTGAQAFNGPGVVASIQADPAAQRLWFKSLSGGDETWWVFDARVGTYLGVVGIGDTVGARLTGLGRHGHVDPATGRLYVIEGWSSTQGLEGGIFVADGRRNPVPQATIHRGLPMQTIMHETTRDSSSGEVDFARDENGNLTEEYHWDISDSPELRHPVVVDPADGDRPRRVFVRAGGNADSWRWYVIADRRPVDDTIADPDEILEFGIDDPPATTDVPLRDGLTRATFNGSARAYGFRTLLLGGTDAAYLPGDNASLIRRLLPEIVLGLEPSVLNLDDVIDPDEPVRAWLSRRGDAGRHPCGITTRDFTFGLTGSTATAGAPATSLQPGGSIGAATPALTDNETRRDLQDPVGRCGQSQLAWLNDLPAIAADEAGARDPGPLVGDDTSVLGYDGEVFDRDVTCTAPDVGPDGSARPSTQDASGDEALLGPTFAAAVECREELATIGSSRARFVGAGPVTVNETASTYDIQRDVATGSLHATARAYARGISILHDVTGPAGEVIGTSTVTIDTVETRAEAWATGRPSSEDATGCDVRDHTRGAGTCVQTTFTGVTVVDGVTRQMEFQCKQDCGASNQQVVAAMQSALGADWSVRLREPDARLAGGSSNGTLAALQKREVDTFADIVTKGDLLKTLPALEMVRYNDSEDGRGRQVYLFAGVELGTVFTRQCLGIVEGQECVAPPVPLAQVGLSLTDALDGSPLAGGRFELAQTSVVEGATPLDAPVSCTTNATGRCELVGLPAGSYMLTQTDAPGEYAPAEPFPLQLSPGSIFDVQVTNVRQVGTVVAGLTDLDGVPLAGGMFELHADVDGDGTVGVDDPQAEVCTTGPDGTCTMADVPLGGYVLAQAAAPEGFVAVDDQVPFVLDSPGQTATIGYTNAPVVPTVETDSGDSGETGDSGDSGRADSRGGDGTLREITELPPIQPVAVARPPGAVGPQVAGPQASQPLVVAPWPQRLQATLELLRRNPVQAAAFGLLLALVAAAVAGPMRRRLLLLTTA